MKISSNATEITSNAKTATASRVMITSYSIEEGKLFPGEIVKLKIGFKNTSKTNDVSNVLVSYTGEGNGVYPVLGKGNQLYIEKIEANKIQYVTIALEVQKGLEVTNVPVNFGVEYVDEKTGKSSNLATIVLPIMQNETLEISNLTVSATGTLGAKSLVSISYKNIGQEEIKSLRMLLNGKIYEEQKEVDLGNLEAGEMKYLDYYVNFLKVGEQRLNISFSYQDTYGNQYTIEEQEFNISVSESVAGLQTPKTQEAQAGSQGFKIELWFLFILGGMVCFVGIVVLLFKKKKRK